MHIRKTETKVYSFAELSPEAQQRAMEHVSAAASECFGENLSCEYDHFADTAKLLGWDIRTRIVRLKNGTMRTEPAIYYSGFWSQGDGACCEGTWRATDCRAKELKKEFPQDAELHRIADEFAGVAALYPDASFSVKHCGRYYHSGCTEFDFDSGCDQEVDEGSERDRAFHARYGVADDLKTTARRFMDWIYSRLEAEYEYQTGEEAAREACESAGEVFNENGDYV